MIRYQITLEDLVDRIEAVKPTWIKRAEARTNGYVAAQDYTGGTDFWGEIKTVYIDLQHEKCAYCETKLQGAILASKVHEVEHYRPKQSVKLWPNSNVPHRANLHPTWPVGGASNNGYFALAYHPLNYAIACTRCNSTLKSNYFPVGGTRNVTGSHPVNLRSESPLLIYPISDVDADDPIDLINFDGVLAIPKHANGRAYERAVTNIEFFQLNHEDLTTRRGQEIVKLWIALEESAKPKSGKSGTQALKIVNSICSESSQFSACMNQFKALYLTNHAKAERIADLLVDALPS